MALASRLRLLLPVIALGLGSAPARAANYCVATATQLRNAITTAAASAEDDVIKLVRGNYTLSAQLVASINGSLVLRGGYGAACPALGRSLDASQTRVVGSPVQQVFLQLRPRGATDLEIDGISFEDFSVVSISDEGTAASANGQVYVRRSRFRGGESGLDIYTRSKHVRVENNVFTNNFSQCCGSDLLNLGLSVRHPLTGSAAVALDVVFNTIIDNPKGLLLQGGGPLSRVPIVQNNIMRQSSANALSLKLDAIRVSATNNIWGMVGTEDGGGFVANLLNVEADPQLGADLVPLPGSPAVNAGTDFVVGGVPTTDFDGGPRQIGSLPDRGALESAISDIGVITVTSTANSGPGTLRQAILDSNQTVNAELIRFNLGAAGGCPYVIPLSSVLPPITSPLTIDGWSQPGSTPNSERLSDDSVRCVVLSGTVAQGLRLQPPADRQIKVSGLAFYGNSDAAIEVVGAGTVVIEGNGFGLGASVLASDFGGDAIRITGADGSRIGGEDEAQRNLIGRAPGAGIRLLAGSGREVINNFIGITRNGYGTVANGIGIHATNGVADLIEDNYIGHNQAEGILVDGASTRDVEIRTNFVGRAPTRNPDASIAFDAGNGNDGIRIAAGSGHEIASNNVAFNGGDGVVVLANAIARINANRIYENAGLGIDLTPNGIDAQDSDLVGTGRGNRGQNYPVLTAAIGANNEGIVTGTLPSSTGQFTIQLFASRECEASDRGEGESIIGTANVTIGGVPAPGGGTLPIDNNVPFTAGVTSQFSNFGLIGRYITATATRLSDGTTSEFSDCIPYEAGPEIFRNGFEE